MGTFTQECGNLYRVTSAILKPCRTFICEPSKPSLGNFYSGTLWTRPLRNLYVGTQRTFTLGTVGAFLKTWTCKPCENQYHVTFGTLGTLGTFTRNCCGNLHSVTLATLEALWNFTWEPCGNLYHGNLGHLGRTCTRQPLLGNLSSGSLWERLLERLGNLYLRNVGAL